LPPFQQVPDFPQVLFEHGLALRKTPVPTRSNTQKRHGDGFRLLFVTALVLCGVAAGGCSNLASQAANVEGVRLYQQGNYQQASDRFQQAIAQDPKSPDGYYNLAAALHKTGTLYNRPSDLQQAENLYNQCLERDPNHTECYRGLAVLLTETGRQQEAFKLLNNWSNAAPKSADPKIELARLLEEVGQLEQAKAQLVEALTIDPHNARALTALGRLRDQAGDHIQALANYQRSLSLNRFQPEVAARVAQLQGALGASIPPGTSPDARTATGPQPTARY
jgi:tetratricopeptide (TPR) repeat protein